MRKNNISHSLPKNVPLLGRICFSSGLSMILDNEELLRIERTAKRKHIFGLAVDLGTTTICVSLCNLETAEELSTATVTNEQSCYGLDLQSRIKFAKRLRKNYTILSQAAVSSLNKAISECVQKSGVDRARIYVALIVGNPMMYHFLFQIPVKRKVDGFEYVHEKVHKVKAGILGLGINPDANVRFMPGVDYVIGSDVLAGILALRLFKSKDIRLCVDVGSNGKIALGLRSEVVVSSTAADSSLEGAFIKCGMVAKPGAIEWLRINKKKIKFLTVGHIRPQGICGSGIIDILSELLKERIIDKDGNMNTKSFLIYKDKKTKIEITTDDIKKVLTSKAAVAAGINVLLRKLKVKPKQVKKIFLTGALGDYLNAENIRRIGIIPRELEARIAFVGNAAFSGAKLALLSKSEFQRMLALAHEVKHVLLPKDKDFHKAYHQALSF